MTTIGRNTPAQLANAQNAEIPAGTQPSAPKKPDLLVPAAPLPAAGIPSGKPVASAQQIARAVGKLDVAPAKEADPFVTFFVSAKPRTDGKERLTFPEATRTALRALEESHKEDFQKLEANEIGASFFETDSIYKVRASLVPELEKACGDGCTMTELGKVIAAPKWAGPVDASIIDAIKHGSVIDKLGAIAALQSGPPAGLDAKQSIQLLFAIANAASTVAALYGAVMRDVIQPRRAELLEELDKKDKGSPASAGRSFNNYFLAGAQARAELAAAGGTPETNAFAARMLECAKAIEKLDTPAGRHMLDQLVDQAGGIVYDHFTADSTLAGSIVKHWEDKMSEALIKNVAAMEKGRTGSASGGREYLGSSYDLTSVSTWSEDYPFSELSSKFTMFLGAKDPEVARAARDAIRRIVLATDSVLPQLQTLHKEHYIQERTANLPEEYRTPERLAAVRESAERGYGENHRLTGVRDVTFLITGLSYGQTFEAEGFSASGLALQKARLITSLVKSVKSPDLKADLANAAIGFFILSTQAPELFVTAEAKAALADVVACATGPDVPADVSATAGTVLAGKGATQLFPRVVEGLRSSDDELRRNSMNVIEAYLTVAGGSLEGINNPAPFQLLSPAAKAKLGELAKSTIPELREILAKGESTWARIDAARLLAKCGASDLGDAVTYLRALATPELTPVVFGTKYAGTKNDAVRSHAMQALAYCGKAADPARAELAAYAALGAKAAELGKYLTERAAGKGSEYLAEGDPEAIERCKAFLKEVATPGSRAQASLDFIAASKPEELAKIPSYSRRDQPFARTVVAELEALGKTAQATLDALDGKAKPKES